VTPAILPGVIAGAGNAPVNPVAISFGSANATFADAGLAVAFAPQLVETWETSGEGLSWMMLALFGSGTVLCIVYGVLRMSGPVMLANGLTGLQVLFLIALKRWFANRVRQRAPEKAERFLPNFYQRRETRRIAVES
jgi:uncharacterized protein with PQ loop repeat